MSILHLIPPLCKLPKIDRIIAILVAIIGFVATFLTVKADPKKIRLLRKIYAFLGIGALIISQLWLLVFVPFLNGGLFVAAVGSVLAIHALILPELRIQTSILKRFKCLKNKDKKHKPKPKPRH